MKLTDKQRMEIIAKYVGGGVSQRDLAKSYQVSQNTISKILNSEEVKQKLSQVEADNFLSMTAYINEKRHIAQELMTKALESAKSKIDKATLKDMISLVEKLSNVFKEQSSENEKDGANKAVVEFVFKDCSLSGEEDGK